MTYRWKHSSLENKKNNCFKGYSNKVLDKEYIEKNNIIDNLNEYKHLDFSNSKFQEDIIFDGYEFYGDIIFENTIFKGRVSFENCVFHGDCIFVNTKFNEIDKNKKIFLKSKIKGQYFIFKNIENMPRLDGIVFSNCNKLVLEDIKFCKNEYEHAKLIYRIARNQANSIGDYERVGHYYYLERYYGGKTIKRENYSKNIEYINNKFFDVLSKYTIGYGEKPFNIFFISFLIVSVFACIYMFTGVEIISTNKNIGLNLNSQYTMNNLLSDYIDLWYFSMATFSTVGYGDLVASTSLGKIIASVEVFFGVTMAASWASVIIKRMSR